MTSVEARNTALCSLKSWLDPWAGVKVHKRIHCLHHLRGFPSYSIETRHKYTGIEYESALRFPSMSCNLLILDLSLFLHSLPSHHVHQSADVPLTTWRIPRSTFLLSGRRQQYYYSTKSASIVQVNPLNLNPVAHLSNNVSRQQHRRTNFTTRIPSNTRAKKIQLLTRKHLLHQG